MAKKNYFGFQKKFRTQEEIDREYQFHALQTGHKLETIRDLDAQVGEHQEALKRLKLESAELNQFKSLQAKKERAKLDAPSPAPLPAAPVEQPAPQVSQ